MEPRIQYAKTSDGVSIAYWTMGEAAPALVSTSVLGVSNISLEFGRSDLRRWYEHVATHRMLVRFDQRSCGLSQRGVSDLSLGAFVLDVETLIDTLHLDRFDLLACGMTATPAIGYAAKHPEMVSRIVMSGATARFADAFGGPERFDALVSLAERDWELATETIARATMGWSSGRDVRVWEPHEWAEFIRASINQADLVRLWRSSSDFDVSTDLANISASTLILHRPGLPEALGHAQAFASAIPNAKLVHLRAASLTPLIENEEGMRLVERFFDIPPPMADVGVASGTADTPVAVILFADIADSTAFTERLGDMTFRERRGSWTARCERSSASIREPPLRVSSSAMGS